eukprot:scaffold202795_cov53-Prasinocladus_malaysianus.AAC.1
MPRQTEPACCEASPPCRRPGPQGPPPLRSRDQAHRSHRMPVSSISSDSGGPVSMLPISSKGIEAKELVPYLLLAQTAPDLEENVTVIHVAGLGDDLLKSRALAGLDGHIHRPLRNHRHKQASEKHSDSTNGITCLQILQLAGKIKHGFGVHGLIPKVLILIPELTGALN